jgi:hypothetical protein
MTSLAVTRRALGLTRRAVDTHDGRMKSTVEDSARAQADGGACGPPPARTPASRQCPTRMELTYRTGRAVATFADERLRPDVRIVMQTGRGKGNAVAAGFAAFTVEIVVTLDADGSTDAAEIPASWPRCATAPTSQHRASPKAAPSRPSACPPPPAGSGDRAFECPAHPVTVALIAQPSTSYRARSSVTSASSCAARRRGASVKMVTQGHHPRGRMSPRRIVERRFAVSRHNPRFRSRPGRPITCAAPPARSMSSTRTAPTRCSLSRRRASGAPRSSHRWRQWCVPAAVAIRRRTPAAVYVATTTICLLQSDAALLCRRLPTAANRVRVVLKEVDLGRSGERGHSLRSAFSCSPWGGCCARSASSIGCSTSDSTASGDSIESSSHRGSVARATPASPMPTATPSRSPAAPSSWPRDS